MLACRLLVVVLLWIYCINKKLKKYAKAKIWSVNTRNLRSDHTTTKFNRYCIIYTAYAHYTVHIYDLASHNLCWLLVLIWIYANIFLLLVSRISPPNPFSNIVLYIDYVHGILNRGRWARLETIDPPKSVCLLVTRKVDSLQSVPEIKTCARRDRILYHDPV